MADGKEWREQMSTARWIHFGFSINVSLRTRAFTVTEFNSLHGLSTVSVPSPDTRVIWKARSNMAEPNCCLHKRSDRRKHCSVNGRLLRKSSHCLPYMEAVSSLSFSQKHDARQYSEPDQPCRIPHTRYVFMTHSDLRPRVPRGILDDSSLQDPVLMSANSVT